MISRKKLDEIRKYAVNSENPLFFFDDDSDGVCSFLLLRKLAGAGTGSVVKSSPVLDAGFLGRVEEHNPDAVFVLDKPKIEQEFVDAVNVPVVWIDHHEPQKVKGTHYYNPREENMQDGRCTTYWCYKALGRRQEENGCNNMWIAFTGCIADWQVPDFADEFERKYGLLDGKRDASKILFETRAGELCRVFSFLLKGKMSDVKRRVNALLKIKSPFEILNKESEAGKFLAREAEKVKRRYDELIKMAAGVEPRGKLHVFTYPSCKLSLTSDLSNELLHRYPDRIILVGREKSGYVRISLRSNGFVLPKALQKSLEGVEGYGGGHEYACGGSIAAKDFEKFISNLEKYICAGRRG